MNNYDDLFEQKQNSNQPDQPFDKDAWCKAKQEQREEVYAMIDEATQAISRNGAAFQNYLDVQSRFIRYSVANALLVLAQKPEAMRIADFDTWKEQGAYVRKNEKGLYILEPGDEYTRGDGSSGVSYNPKKMFDISQTSNAPNNSNPAYPDDRARIKALTDHATVPININDALPSGVNAVYQPETRDIQIRRGMNPGDIFRALSQELAHAEMDKGDGSYNRSEHGFQAYCASYMLCKRYGVDTAGYFHFDGAPQVLEAKEPQEVRAELSGVRNAAGEISNRMNKTLNQQRQQKQQGQER